MLQVPALNLACEQPSIFDFTEPAVPCLVPAFDLQTWSGSLAFQEAAVDCGSPALHTSEGRTDSVVHAAAPPARIAMPFVNAGVAAVPRCQRLSCFHLACCGQKQFLVWADVVQTCERLGIDSGIHADMRCASGSFPRVLDGNPGACALFSLRCAPVCFAGRFHSHGMRRPISLTPMPGMYATPRAFAHISGLPSHVLWHCNFAAKCLLQLLLGNFAVPHVLGLHSPARTLCLSTHSQTASEGPFLVKYRFALRNAKNKRTRCLGAAGAASAFTTSQNSACDIDALCATSACISLQQPSRKRLRWKAGVVKPKLAQIWGWHLHSRAFASKTRMLLEDFVILRGIDACEIARHAPLCAAILRGHLVGRILQV